MKFVKDLQKVKCIKPYRRDKNRYATPNEIAKSMILESLEGLFYDWNEKSHTSDLSNKERIEVQKHLEKHILAIRKKYNWIDSNIQMTNYEHEKV